MNQRKQLPVKGQTLEIRKMNHELVKHLFTAILCEGGDTVTAKRPEDVKSSNLISVTLLICLMAQNHSGFLCQGFQVRRTCSTHKILRAVTFLQFNAHGLA